MRGRQPVPARPGLLPTPLGQRGLGRHLGQRGVDRAGAQPEVGRRAAGHADPLHRVQQAPLEVLGEGRLPGDAAGLLEADRRGGDGLVRSALGRQGDAGRGADQDRLTARVDPVRPGLERAGDERVVQRRDRDQPLAPPGPGRAELAQQRDQVDLGDAELDVLAVADLAPAQHPLGVVREPVVPVPHRPHPGLVDPAAEVGRRGDVGAAGDHPGGRLRGVVREVGQEAAEGGLGGDRLAVRVAELGRDGDRSRRRHRLPVQLPRPVLAQPAGRVPGSNRCHGRAGSAPEAAARACIWAAVSSAE